jgi:excisionase family DNA binding protein
VSDVVELRPMQVTIADAASTLGLSYSTVQRMATSGKIGSVGDGRRTRIPLDEVERMRQTLETQERTNPDLTLSEAAQMLGYCYTVAQRMVKSGELQGYRGSKGEWRITRGAIETWQSENRNG